MDHSHAMHVTAYRQRSRAHSVGRGVTLGDLAAAAHPARQRCSNAAAPLAATMSAACACAACAVNRSSSALSRARSSAMRAIRLWRSCLRTSRVTGFKAALLCRSNVLYSTLTFFSRVRSSAISCIDFPPSPALVAILMTTKRRSLDRPAACVARVARPAQRQSRACGGQPTLTTRPGGGPRVRLPSEAPRATLPGRHFLEAAQDLDLVLKLRHAIHGVEHHHLGAEL